MRKLIGLIPQEWKNIYHRLQAYIANVRYGFPSKSLKIIGVTGTDGKTTTATMIYEILRRSGLKVGLITTVSAKVGKKEYPTGFHVTTPGPEDLPRYLRMMLDEGLEWVVLEVTSHGLDQNRVAFIEFEKAVYTKITHEHLDYHRTWRSYAKAKAKLLEVVKEGGDVIYKDDEMGGEFIKKKIEKGKRVLIQSVCNQRQIDKKNMTREGISFTTNIKNKSCDLYMPIIGEYNIANALCAIKTCEDLVEPSDIIEAFESFKGIKGRMNIVRKKRPSMIIIDFAHTPNALENALMTANSIKESGNVILVFGAAGLRDKKKRFMMGEISAKYADIVILTAEDPRTESLEKINRQILKGARKNNAILVKKFSDRKSFRKYNFKTLKKRGYIAREKEGVPFVIFNQESVKSREDAIEFAIKIAASSDIVIITGKGHEESLCFGEKEYPWSDFRAVERALKRRSKLK